MSLCPESIKNDNETWSKFESIDFGIVDEDLHFEFTGIKIIFQIHTIGDIQKIKTWIQEFLQKDCNEESDKKTRSKILGKVISATDYFEDEPQYLFSLIENTFEFGFTGGKFMRGAARSMLAWYGKYAPENISDPNTFLTGLLTQIDREKFPEDFALFVRLYVRWLKEQDENNPKIFVLYQIQRNSSERAGNLFLQRDALSGMIEWIADNPEMPQGEIWDYIERMFELSPHINPKTVSKNLDEITTICKKSYIFSDNRYLYLINKLLKVNKDDIPFKSRLLGLKFEWIKTQKPEDISSGLKILNEQLVLAKKGGNLRDQSFKIQKLIDFYIGNLPGMKDEVIVLYRDKIRVNMEDLDWKQAALTYNKLLNLIDFTNKEICQEMWDFGESILEIVDRDDHYYILAVISDQWIKILDKLDWEINETRLLKLVDMNLRANKNMPMLDRVISRLQYILDKLENGLFSEQYEIESIVNQIIETLSDNRLDWEDMEISLRFLARWKKKNPDYELIEIPPSLFEFKNDNPFYIIYHIATIRLLNPNYETPIIPLPNYDSEFVDQIIRQALEMVIGQGSSKSALELDEQIITMDVIIGEDGINPLYSESIHNYGLKILLSLESPFIVDGPNLFYKVKGAKEVNDPVKIIQKWVKSLDSDVVFHLSLHSLRDHKDIIQELQKTTDIKWMLMLDIDSGRPEDLGLLLASEISGGRIVSNDKFRQEILDYGDVISEEVFERVSNFTILPSEMVLN